MPVKTGTFPFPANPITRPAFWKLIRSRGIKKLRIFSARKPDAKVVAVRSESCQQSGSGRTGSGGHAGERDATGAISNVSPMNCSDRAVTKSKMPTTVTEMRLQQCNVMEMETLMSEMHLWMLGRFQNQYTQQTALTSPNNLVPSRL